MQTFDNYAAAATSYVAALLALCVDHSSTIIQFLGFVLLVARLVKEVPAAYNMIVKWCRRA